MPPPVLLRSDTVHVQERARSGEEQAVVDEVVERDVLDVKLTAREEPDPQEAVLEPMIERLRMMTTSFTPRSR